MKHRHENDFLNFKWNLIKVLFILDIWYSLQFAFYSSAILVALNNLIFQLKFSW